MQLVLGMRSEQYNKKIMKSIAQCLARQSGYWLERNDLFFTVAAGKMPAFAVYIRFFPKLIW